MRATGRPSLPGRGRFQESITVGPSGAHLHPDAGQPNWPTRDSGFRSAFPGRGSRRCREHRVELPSDADLAMAHVAAISARLAGTPSSVTLCGGAHGDVPTLWRADPDRNRCDHRAGSVWTSHHPRRQLHRAPVHGRARVATRRRVIGLGHAEVGHPVRSARHWCAGSPLRPGPALQRGQRPPRTKSQP